jgi:choline dehydrogenase-like flavoprotein
MIRARHDVVIIGSGPTGGYAAKVLSEAGIRVLVLDAGRHPLHDKALAAMDSMRRKAGFKIEEDPAAVRRQPIQSSCYAWAQHPHAFVDDLALPYRTEAHQPFVWIRSRHVGGRMVVRQHGLQYYRLSDRDFLAGADDGLSAVWPMTYAELEPYYERVERWLRIRGTKDYLPQLPDSVLSGGRDLNAGERRLASAVAKHWHDRTVIPGRTARPALPIVDALATRRCTLRSNAVVTELVASESGDRVDRVVFVDRRTGRRHAVSAPVVVLCASAIESARLMLASVSARHPYGLGNSSGVVGRYLMDHIHLMGIHSTMPLHEPVQTPSWAYIPRFRNVGGSDAPFARGYGIQVFTMWRECAFTMFGEMLPHSDNRVTLDTSRTDAYGVPLAHITCVHRENEHAMGADAAKACREHIEAAGFTPRRLNAELSAPGLACHELGTVRMGNDPRDSALNSYCQAWDVPNLFVMDGSCWVTQGAQNPTLTMMAIAARACDRLIEASRRGALQRATLTR